MFRETAKKIISSLEVAHSYKSIIDIIKSTSEKITMVVQSAHFLFAGTVR
jgi:hypothetical protein